MNAVSSVTLTEAEDIAKGHLRAIASADYPSLVRSQRGPWPSIMTGAAGLAYAIWFTADENDALLERAEALLNGAASAPDDHYWPADCGEWREVRASLYYGPAGIECVRVLIASARGDERAYEEAFSRFLVVCRASTSGPEELLFGVAGLLNGVRILLRHTAEERLVPAGNELARDLTRRLTSESSAWTAPGTWRFGHGAGGILHALLAWMDDTNHPLGLGAWRLLDELARAADTSEQAHAGVGALLRRSWCNGSAGDALLWAKAYEVSADPLHLKLARASALGTFSFASIPVGDLCCGLAGRGYACLALDRIDGGRGWAERAGTFALRATRAMSAREGSWPSGLYKGYPGLACLLRDIRCEPRVRGGFPLVEG